MNNDNTADIKDNFYKSLNELYDLVQKSEVKEKLPYVKPMNLKPIVSSVDVMGTMPSKESSPKALQSLLSKYGALKKELGDVAKDISILTGLELEKKIFSKMRESIRLEPGLTEFEKLNKDKEIKNNVKKTKEHIGVLFSRIDSGMENIDMRVKDLTRLMRTFEKNYVEICSIINTIKKGEKLPEEKAEKLKGVDINRILKRKSDLSFGVKYCNDVIKAAMNKKDSLKRTMWLETPIQEKQTVEISAKKESTRSRKEKTM